MVHQPQLWYNGVKGSKRAETEINGGDMLVHFAKIHYGDRVTRLEKEIMSEWFTKIKPHPDKGQVPFETTKYPKEIEVFWRTYREAREVLDTVYVRLG